jgi:hypothetical protein
VITIRKAELLISNNKSKKASFLTTDAQPRIFLLQWMVTPTSTGYFGRFRAFVADNAAISGAKQSTVGITLFNADGTVTAIKGITVKDLTAGDGKIYSINGEYIGTDINNLAPGLYIKNGKKFIKQ